MFKVLSLVMLLSCFSFAAIRPAKIVADFEQSVEDNDALPENINQAVNNLIFYAADALRERGFNDDAEQIQVDWLYVYHHDVFWDYKQRGIPDHKPMWQWLDDVMQKVIGKLGRPFCVNSHICDLYTFNQTLPIAWNVFTKKCNFEMQVSGTAKDEHRRCMVTDGVFDGLYPVVVYWITEGSCLAAGGSLACGLLAMAAEGICEKFVCGPLADRIYTRKCGG